MRRIIWICLLAPMLASSAFSWGCDGHEIVALIARAHLTPEVSAAVDTLLTANPIDPALSRFCKERLDDPMADSSTWADDMRTPAKNGPWHFIDIPRRMTAVGPLEPYCPPVGPHVEGKEQTGCVITALQYNLAILRDKGADPGERASALRYVIHFVGDIHQPLHNLDEQGGNCTTVRFDGDDRPTNLHSLWDSRLIQYEEQREKVATLDYAKELNSRFAAKYATLANSPVNDFAAWAWAGSVIGRTVVYGNLEPHIPLQETGVEIVCATERKKVEALQIVIGEAYSAKAIPVIEEQLATAGFRLALLLNATL